jgi:hypothetical protein
MTGRPALPCPGSPGEQPAALMDAFSLLDMIDGERDE